MKLRYGLISLGRHIGERVLANMRAMHYLLA